MTQTKIIKTLATLILLSVPALCFSQEQPAQPSTTPADVTPQASSTTPSMKNNREGYYVGLGLGGAQTNFDVDTVTFDSSGLLFDIHGGYGVSETLLFGLNIYGFNAKLDGTTNVAGTPITANNTQVNLYGMMATAQLFFWKDAYSRLGFGWANAKAETTVGSVTVSGESKTGFSTQANAGYEMRFGRYFALAPEASFTYYRIQGGNTFSYGGLLNTNFYF